MWEINTQLRLDGWILLVVYLPSCVRLFVTPQTVAQQVSLSLIISWSLLKLMSFESMMLSNHLILCHPLLLPSVFPSIRVFSSESALHNRWPKYHSFSFSISPSKEYSGLVSLRIDWFDLLAFQGSLKSLLQPHSLKSINSSVLWLLLLSSSHFHTWQLERPCCCCCC